MLAGVIRAPSHYAPTRDLALARQRAAVVLDAMVEAGLATAAQAAAAKAAPGGPGGAGDARRQRLVRRLGGRREPALCRRRSSPASWSTRPSTSACRRPPRRRSRASSRAPAPRSMQAALVAMSPTGEVRAMLGGRSYAKSQFNRATQAERQPGSAFKLFVYLAALEDGLRPEDVISAAPLEVDGWRPRNDQDDYPAALTLMDAFALSVNTAAVRLSEQVGRGAVIRTAERLGITSELRDDPSLALGSSEVHLLELTGAYASIANGGRLVWPEAILSIEGAGDKTLYRRRAVDEPVLEPATVRAMTAMLEMALRRGTGRQAALRRFVAGKTGTSSENRDAWFIGFSDQLVVGVWVGNDDGRPMAGVERRRPAGADLPRLHPARAGRRGVPPATAAAQAARGAAGRRARRPRRRPGQLDQGLVRLAAAHPAASQEGARARRLPAQKEAVCASLIDRRCCF